MSRTLQPCQGCPSLEVCKRASGAESPVIQELSARSLTPQHLASSHTTLIFAKADAIRECSLCKRSFQDALKLPEVWWTPWCRRLNGYFGCDETTDDEGVPDGYNTWFRFYAKQMVKDTPPGQKDYFWYKYNIFTRWVASGNHTTIVVFDPRLTDRETLVSSLLHTRDAATLADPYWVHVHILEEVIRRQDSAVWGICGMVRHLEQNREPPSAPNPNYARLHDIARHAIHVWETTDLAIRTLDHMLLQHAQFLDGRPQPQTASAKDRAAAAAHATVTRRFHFFKHAMQSLGHRAGATKERMLNEIQLAFHAVAQYDSQIAVEIGRATQYDSFCMKMLAFLTLTFLPATFVSALFSMSFFDFDPDNGWAVSDRIWIYWAVATPITCGTVLLWFFWPRVFPPEVVGQVRIKPRGEDSAMRLETIEITEELMTKSNKYGATMMTV